MVNNISSSFLIFILLVIITISILFIYNVVKPTPLDLEPSLNFQPYPQIAPKNIPSNNIDDTSKSCYKYLTKCNLTDDPSLQCNSCSNDFKCTKVTNSNIIINNQLVPDTEGNNGWCLPKLKDGEKCNSFTGRWIWSNDEKCQNQSTTNDQCWSCQCLYPDLFNGNDCSTQLACKAIKTNVSSTAGQSNNVLKSSTDIKSSSGDVIMPAGTIYNPNNTNPNNPETIALKYNPYSTINGKPLFECECNGDSCNTKEDCIKLGYPEGYGCNKSTNQCVSYTDVGDGKSVFDNKFSPFVKLPNDPYMCHYNPCRKFNNGNNTESVKTKSSCSNDSTKPCKQNSDCGDGNTCNFLCDCEASGNEAVTVNSQFDATKENNNLYNTCIDKIDLPCTFDIRNKECLCIRGYNRKCKSNHANIGSELPKCLDSNNPIGYECYDPCPGETCNNRGLLSYKTGTCSLKPDISCTSNKICVEANAGFCKYPETCTCDCNIKNTCSAINLVFGNKSTDGGIGGSLENGFDIKGICNSYEGCKYSEGSGCNVDQDKINMQKPFPNCKNPSFSGDKCENIICDDDSKLSYMAYSTGQGIVGGVSYNYYVNKDLVKYCKANNRDAVNKKIIDKYDKDFINNIFGHCVDIIDDSKKCLITCYESSE
jgi:hypothetical protein